MSATATPARRGRLRRADCAGPGIRRVRRGRGFSYEDTSGEAIKDEETLERIGSEIYAEKNESFGLATVRREHVTIKRNEVVFDFPAKSGQRRVQSIRDAAARRALEAMHRRRARGPARLPPGQPMARCPL